ncbi:MAG: phosphoribosyl-AMP cyclohydrolase [Gammaproteobacteria bacterium]
MPQSIWLDQLRWNDEGLIPAVAQEYVSGRVLMLAWMNREALRRTVEEGYAIYWSRSRDRLWKKGEESGHVQRVRELRLDCDNDAVLLLVEQTGGVACHTGRESCFFQRLEDGSWRITAPVVKQPREMYRSQECNGRNPVTLV